MSEEQSGFKITDRRLFNPDGTPREVPQDEAPAPAAAAPAKSESEPASSAPQADDVAAPTPTEQPRDAEPAKAETTIPPSDAVAGSEQEEFPEEAYGDEAEIPGANDPASFVNFLMSIASNAAAALGMMEHPVTGQRGVDLPLGKHWIDVLGMLEEKTRGNLALQEQQIFTGLLSDLRMQYVSLTRNAQGKRPGGFTASDILGGK